MKDFDELEWIEKFYEGRMNLHVEGIDRIRNFAFLWNMFETFACNTKADLNSISVAVDKYFDVDVNDLTEFVDYFNKRYMAKDGSTTRYFSGLKFRSSGGEVPAKALVEDVLMRKTDTNKAVLKALLYILYRFRNNLFHGGKQIETISQQIDNFVVANHLLSYLLDKMKANCDIVI